MQVLATFSLFWLALAVLFCPLSSKTTIGNNPIHSEGWYADPEIAIFEDTYWIFPTTSGRFENQLHFDAFSSKDLVDWTLHSNILVREDVSWLRKALWAPCVVQNKEQYFLFFAANDIQSPVSPWWNPEIHHEGEVGGIGVAVADQPEGPYRDYLGSPLIGEVINRAQPIDQAVYQDVDGTWYILYGGWGHCNVGMLKDDFTGLVPFTDGELVKEITPEGYVEGPVLFRRGETYYFMWSEGNWTQDNYRVVYATGASPLGPFERKGTILQADPSVATGAGHHSVLNIPGTDHWYIIYHRRPIPNLDRDHRVVCIDRMDFNASGDILPVVMTFKGVTDPQTITTNP